MKITLFKIFIIFLFYISAISYVKTLLAAPASTPVQETIVLNPVADTYISAYRPTANYGSSTNFQVGYMTSSGQRFVYDTLMKFDLSQIPVGSTINSANITIKRSTTVGLPGAIRLGMLNGSWGESSVTWNSRPSLRSSSVGNIADPNSDKFVVTSFVQEMVRSSQPITNYGFYIYTAAFNGAFNIYYYAKESSTNKPTLTITFTRPVTPSPSGNVSIPLFSIAPLISPLPSIYIPPLTPDSVAPQVTNVTHTVTSTTATIYWRTDEDSQGKIIYGKRGFWDLESQPTATGRTHSVTLTNLDSAATYNYKVKVADRWANSRYSPIYEFDTLRSRALPSPTNSAVPLTSSTPAPAGGGGGVNLGCGLFRFLPFTNCDDDLLVQPDIVSSPAPAEIEGGAQSPDEEEDPVVVEGDPLIEEPSGPMETPQTPEVAFSNIPGVGRLFESIGQALENNLAERTIGLWEESRDEATDSSKPSLNTSNPLVLVGSYIGVNRLVGVALLIIGLIIIVVGLLILRLSHKTYHKIRGNSQNGSFNQKKPFKKGKNKISNNKRFP